MLQSSIIPYFIFLVHVIKRNLLLCNMAPLEWKRKVTNFGTDLETLHYIMIVFHLPAHQAFKCLTWYLPLTNHFLNRELEYFNWHFKFVKKEDLS